MATKAALCSWLCDQAGPYLCAFCAVAVQLCRGATAERGVRSLGCTGRYAVAAVAPLPDRLWAVASVGVSGPALPAAPGRSDLALDLDSGRCSSALCSP